MLEIRAVTVSLDADEAALKKAAAKKLGVRASDIKKIKILRRSVDARKKTNVCLVMTVAAGVHGDENRLSLRTGAPIYRPAAVMVVERLEKEPACRPVICGGGPAGLFAALYLAKAGARPLLIERGDDADRRLEKIELFAKRRILDEDTNVQFGEGGAGTFSDGKLTTNINDRRCAEVLRTFADHGAPEEILWQAKPHIGTDRLPEVVKSIRRKIEELGGEVKFNTKLSDVGLRDGRLERVTIESGGESRSLNADRLIIAAGHSARDVFRLLYDKGAALEQKPFSIGVRIEHPRELIDRAQYGPFAGHRALGAADYKLSCHLPDGRNVYTFCMCPGGEVVAAASESGGVVVNGMSRFARDGGNSNSAFLANVTPEDFGSAHPLAGIEFQRKWEKAAFELGGGDYSAPCQLLGDFLQRTPSRSAGAVAPSYPLGVRYCDVSGCLPEFASDALRRAAGVFDAKLHGFALPDAVLTGVETRSSSPVRVLRDGMCESNLKGIFPCGEGAGYAGGIMSAAVDGLRVAEMVIKSLNGGD